MLEKWQNLGEALDLSFDIEKYCIYFTINRSYMLQLKKQEAI